MQGTWQRIRHVAFEIVRLDGRRKTANYRSWDTYTNWRPLSNLTKGKNRENVRFENSPFAMTIPQASDKRRNKSSGVWLNYLQN